jgi:anti-sigma factor RsiW
MTCDHEDNLTAYLDGELPPLEARRLDAHLKTCAHCTLTLAMLRRTAAALAALPPPASPTWRPALFVEISQQPRARWRPLLAPALGMAAAAALALLLGNGASGPVHVDSEEGLLFAQSGEVLEDYEVVGLEQDADVDLIAHLDELERTP